MSRNCWLLGAALAMFIAAPAMSQQPAKPPQANVGTVRIEAQPRFEIQQSGPNVTFRQVGQPDSSAASREFVPRTYWLGVHTMTVPPALRAHMTLPEKQGLLVLLVAKDSPAAKAGIAQYDILLRAGGKPLADAPDLLAAVEAAKETKLKIDLIHAGKPQSIEVTPAKWPAATGAAAPMPEPADWNTIEDWLKNTFPGQGAAGPQPPVQFRIFHPGAILPSGVLGQKPLPMNMSVSVTKEGNQPAKITVQRGNDKWELTEKDLDKLPADVRPFVDQMLGHGMTGVVGGPAPPMAWGWTSSSGPGGGGAFQFSAPPPAGMSQPPPFPGNLNQQMMEKRFDEINRRMDQLFKMMEELTEGHEQHAAPPPHDKK
ncbi:MAG: PDZ domain-containing protein [Thermoguttaceae bacterium]